jgi:hypothetical protein
MNVVKILLVLGLGYIAMTQKVEKTRNMLLVVTGLLAFCMFSVEGFDSITFTAGANGGPVQTAILDANSGLTVGGQITSSGADGRVYTFPVEFNVGTGVGEVGYTCGANEVKGAVVNSSSGLSAATVAASFPCVSKQLCSAAPPTLTCSSGTKKSGTSDYCAGSTCGQDDFSGDPPACCQPPSPNETCGAGKTKLSATCPGYYTDKASASCGAAACVAADFTSSGACCELPCSDDNCSIYEWLSWGDGVKCGIISKCEA